MSTEIQPFTFPTTGQSVRTVMIDGEPMLCHADICRLLQHSNPSVAIRLVDEDDRRMIDTSETDIHALNRVVPGNARTWFVTESGFFALALASQAPGGKALRRWVTHEVIPALRKTGSYSIAQHEVPTTYAAALRAAAEQAERAELAESKVIELEPAAQAWDTLSNATGDYSLREAAQILSRDPAFPSIGQNRLLKFLRDQGWVDSHSTPYQDQVNLGRLVQRTDTYDHPHTKEPRLYTQVRITPKGLTELRNRLRVAAQLTLNGASR